MPRYTPGEILEKLLEMLGRSDEMEPEAREQAFIAYVGTGSEYTSRLWNRICGPDPDIPDADVPDDVVEDFFGVEVFLFTMHFFSFFRSHNNGGIIETELLHRRIQSRGLAGIRRVAFQVLFAHECLLVGDDGESTDDEVMLYGEDTDNDENERANE